MQKTNICNKHKTAAFPKTRDGSLERRGKKKQQEYLFCFPVLHTYPLKLLFA